MFKKSLTGHLSSFRQLLSSCVHLSNCGGRDEAVNDRNLLDRNFCFRRNFCFVCTLDRYASFILYFVPCVKVFAITPITKTFWSCFKRQFDPLQLLMLQSFVQELLLLLLSSNTKTNWSNTIFESYLLLWTDMPVLFYILFHVSKFLQSHQ